MLNRAHLARVDLNLLLVFDLLFEERNATRTANRLHLSPSAISHALRRLRALLNDPLFLPTARGMVPTQRAESLAPAVREVLDRASGIVASAEEFDPRTATRSVRIGAPDGAISFIVPKLVREIGEQAPGVDISLLQLLPARTSMSPDHAWQDALNDLDGGRLDVALLPHRPSQARFHATELYAEDFVVVAREGHGFARRATPEAFAAAAQVLVSATGDRSGFVDSLLAERGLSRRIALTVPSFHMAIAAIEASDLIGAIPRRFANEAAVSHAIEVVEPPFPLPSSALHAIVPKAALLDPGLVWLLDLLANIYGASAAFTSGQDSD